MRHLREGKKFGRETDQRRALMRGLANNFVLAGKIMTTEAKAKALRPVVEKYITVAKQDTLTNRRKLLAFFYTETAVNKLLKDIGPKYKNRQGGYTRVIKVGQRHGDQAPVAILELV